MSEELIDSAQKLGCSPSFVEFERLPLTFSQIALVAGMTITNPRHQTGPHYSSDTKTSLDFCVETGPEGTAILFNNHGGGTTGEVVLDAPKYRSKTRHIVNAMISFSPGDYRPIMRNRNATLFIGDMGTCLSSTDDNEMTEKYGVYALRRRGWSYNNRAGYDALGFRMQTTGGISIQYAWDKDEHVHGWRNENPSHHATKVIPFFGATKPTRIKPIFEAKFPLQTFKQMLNKAGRKSGAGGALYWAYNHQSKKFYSIGAYEDGTISKEGQNSQVPVWIDNSVEGIVGGTIPYRPFGETIVNRYKEASHAGVGIDDLGRQYICVYYPWGHIRYNHITFNHSVINSDEGQLEGGPLKVTEGEKPPFFENFDLTFEYSPYTDEEERYLSKWYETFIALQEVKVSMPLLPKKGEILNWYLAYCQHGTDVSDEDELLARKILS